MPVLTVCLLVRGGVGAGAVAFAADWLQQKSEIASRKKARTTPSAQPDAADASGADGDTDHDRGTPEEKEEDISIVRMFRAGAIGAAAAPILVTIGWVSATGFAGQGAWKLATAELAMSPLFIVAGTVDDDNTTPGGALHERVPEILLGTLWGTVLSCYVVGAVVLKHRILFLPIISSLGERSPEAAIFTVGGGCGALALAWHANVYQSKYRDETPEFREEAQSATRYAYSASGLAAGFFVFRSGASWMNYVHFPSAVGFTVLGAIYTWKHANLAERIQLREEGKPYSKEDLTQNTPTHQALKHAVAIGSGFMLLNCGGYYYTLLPVTGACEWGVYGCLTRAYLSLPRPSTLEVRPLQCECGGDVIDYDDAKYLDDDATEEGARS